MTVLKAFIQKNLSVKEFTGGVAVWVIVGWCRWVSETLIEQKAMIGEIRVQLVGQKRLPELESKAEKKSMGMKSHKVHYANKYPGGRVHASETSLDVYCAGGKHRVSLQKNGAGMWADQSEEMGCEDRHCLSPLPKEARAMKLYPDGKIGKSEEHAERAPKAREMAAAFGGKVPSEQEYAEFQKKEAAKAKAQAEQAQAQRDAQARAAAQAALAPQA